MNEAVEKLKIKPPDFAHQEKKVPFGPQPQKDVIGFYQFRLGNPTANGNTTYTKVLEECYELNWTADSCIKIKNPITRAILRTTCLCSDRTY